jgi:DNA-binding NarL/FixJ family response regulator
MSIKVILFDDKLSIRESLELLLHTDNRFELAGTFEHAEDAAQIAGILNPDVILMDIDMPGKNGIQAVAEIHKKHPLINIIMLTVFEDSDRVFQSLRNGANGYLLKSTEPAKLLEALADIHSGGAPMSPVIARMVMHHFQIEKAHPTSDYQLTAREKEVLKLLVDGMSYKMIANTLEIGFETVRSHIKKIYDKLHVQTMTEAVSKTLREGLV